MKIKITAYVHLQKYSWDTVGQFVIYSCQLDDTDFRSFVNKQEVEFNVPDGYDPRDQQIAALEAQKTKATADYHKSVMEINDRISKLTAIEFIGEQI